MSVHFTNEIKAEHADKYGVSITCSYLHVECNMKITQYMCKRQSIVHCIGIVCLFIHKRKCLCSLVVVRVQSKSSVWRQPYFHGPSFPSGIYHKEDNDE